VASKGQEPSEVKVVREDDESASAGVIYDFDVRSGWIANRRPMHGWPAALLQKLNPEGAKIHVNEDGHAAGRDISISSTRQAA
jgi:hypothetical protein